MTPQSRRILLLAGFLCLVHTVSSQNSELDSIRYSIVESEGEAKVDALNALASRLQTISSSEAQTALEESLKLSNEIGYTLGSVDAKLVQATINSLTRQYGQADQLIAQVFSMLMSESDKLRMANAYLVSSTHEIRQSHFDKSVDNSFKGLAISREIGNRTMEGNFLFNIAYNYEVVGNLEEAGKYLLEAIVVYKEVGDLYRVGQGYINLGVLEYKKHNLGLSIEHNQKALAIFNRQGDKVQIALSLQNLGFAYWQLKQHQKALTYYERSESIRLDIGDLYGLGKLHLNKAKIYHSLNRNLKVLEASGASLKYADEIHHQILARDVYSFLYDYHLGRKEFELAITNFEQFVAIKDSLAFESNSQKIAEIQAQFEFEELTNENIFQVQQNEIKSLQINQRNFIIVSLFILFLLSLLMFYIQKKRLGIKLLLSDKNSLLAEKETALASALLEAKKNQLNNFTTQLALKEELLREAKTELNRLKTNRLWNEDQAAEFIEKFHESLRLKDWAKFKLYFDAVHPHFFERLNQRFKNLTLNDQRMLAMIHIKLTSKEIAAIINIAPESVVKSKHRLKQKMGLARKEVLEEVLIAVENLTFTHPSVN